MQKDNPTENDIIKIIRSTKPNDNPYLTVISEILSNIYEKKVCNFV